MTDLRTAAQQALEALEKPNAGLVPHNGEWMSIQSIAITALRAALAEPVQEPVAWAVYDIKHGGSKTLHWPEQHSPNGDPEQYKAVPLYSAPPQRLPLTDEEIDAEWRKAASEEGFTTAQFVRAFARAIEWAHGIGEQR